MRVRLLSIWFIIAALFPTNAFSEDDKEIWECNTGPFYSEKKEHNLWLVKGSDSTYVKFYDTRIPAHYYLHGLDRRWDWEGGNFSIRLSPDDKAWYYDFSNAKEGESVSSDSIFTCKKIQG